jgi:hypothetical protein
MEILQEVFVWLNQLINQPNVEITFFLFVTITSIQFAQIFRAYNYFMLISLCFPYIYYDSIRSHLIKIWFYKQ